MPAEMVPRMGAPAPELAELSPAAWQERIAVLRLLCLASSDVRKAEHALRERAWVSAWAWLVLALRHLPSGDDPHRTRALLRSLDRLGKRGATGGLQWSAAIAGVQVLLEEASRRARQTCGVDLPLQTEVAPYLEQALTGTESAYELAQNLLRRGAWRRAWRLLKSLKGYRASNLLMAVAVVGWSAAACLAGLIVFAALKWTVFRSASPATPTATPSPSPVTVVRLAVTCASGKTLTLAPGETLILPVLSAVFITPNALGTQAQAARSGRLTEVDPGRQWAYSATDLAPDIIIFSLQDPTSGETVTAALPVEVTVEAGGSCLR